MKKRKKTLVLAEAFYPEDFLINELVETWEKEGREVEVLTRAPSYPFGKVYKGYKNKIYQTTFFNSIPVHRFPVLQGYDKSTLIKVLNYFTFVFWSFWVVLFIGRRFDRVFIYQTGPLTLATAGILLKKWFGAKVIIWTQDLWPDSVYAYGFKKTKFLSFCLDRFVGWIYKNSDDILVSCEGFAAKLARYVPDKPVRFVPNWSLLEYDSSCRAELPGKFNFTFAGNIGKVQNLENVIAGFAVFVRKHPHAYLNLIGDGSNLEALKEWVKERGVPNVHFTGRVPLQSISGYYTESDVLLISLKDVPIYEITVPSKFQAYLTTSKPIYAIFKGEVKEIVEKYGIGYTADPADVEAIAQGFEYFLNLSAGDLQAISSNCRRLTEQVYDKQCLIKCINTFLDFK